MTYTDRPDSREWPARGDDDHRVSGANGDAIHAYFSAAIRVGPEAEFPRRAAVDPATCPAGNEFYREDEARRGGGPPLAISA